MDKEKESVVTVCCWNFEAIESQDVVSMYSCDLAHPRVGDPDDVDTAHWRKRITCSWSHKNAEIMNQILLLEEAHSFSSDSFFNAESDISLLPPSMLIQSAMTTLCLDLMLNYGKKCSIRK